MIQQRAADLFEKKHGADLRRVNGLLSFVLVAQWAFAIAVAWSGGRHVPMYVLLALGVLLVALPVLLARIRPTAPATRMVFAAVQMAWSAALIELTAGHGATQFHVFGSLALLALYRDWRVFVPATIVIVAGYFGAVPWSDATTQEAGRFVDYVGWVGFEEVFLAVACVRGVREMRRAAAQQIHLEMTEQAEYEVQLAASIQAAMLPRDIRVMGLDMAAKMLPAAEVGGDYYDVLPVPDGCVIGIGDVAGHGLKAGLTMLQTQSVVEALVRSNPQARPADVLAELNRILFDRSHRRGGAKEHMTMSLLRYYVDGRIVAAGAHEDAIVWRAATGRCERLSTQGTWLGMVESIEAVTVETTHRLSEGDLLVLYTDGVVEAMSGGAQFGVERLCTAIEGIARARTGDICDALFAELARWTAGAYEDDATILVVRYLGRRDRAA